MRKKWIAMALAIGILVTNLPAINTFAEVLATDTVGTDTVGTTTVISENAKESTDTAGEEKINNSDFVFDKLTGTISSYKGNAKILTIPSEIDGVAVKRLESTYTTMLPESLGMFIFENKSNIEKVIIPSSVESIDEYTFKNATNLKEVVLSEGLKRIGLYAFDGTPLEKINIPSSLIEISSNAIQSTVWAKATMANNNGFLIINNILCGYNVSDEIIKIPDGVKRINNDIFYGKEKIKEVIVPSSVILIGENNFSKCGILKSVNIDNENVQIGQGCFEKDNDVTISIAGKVVNKDDINKSTFGFDKSTGTITSYKGNSTILEIPSQIDGVSVSAIEASTEMKQKGYGILGDNLTVKKINIPGTVKTIKSGAFKNSINVNKVQFSSGTNSIENFAFEGCSKLDEVRGLIFISDVAKEAFKDTIWQKTDNIETSNSDFVFDKSTGTISAYNGNSRIVTIPAEIDGVAVKKLSPLDAEGMIHSLNMFSYKNGENIEKIIIPGTVETIDKYTFGGCLNLKEVVLQEGVKKIGENAFYGTPLEKVNIPSSLIEVGMDAFGFTPWEKSSFDDKGFLIINNILCGYSKQDEIIKVPEGVKRISEYVFRQNKIIKEVTIPASVEIIESCSFLQSDALKSVSIANKNIQIGENCFNSGTDATINIAGKSVSKEEIKKDYPIVNTSDSSNILLAMLITIVSGIFIFNGYKKKITE